MARPKGKPRASTSTPRDARAAQLLPLFAGGTPHAEIVRLTGVPLRTVQRYARDPAVLAKLEAMRDAAVKGTAEAFTEARDVAIQTLLCVMRDGDASDDARVRASIAVLDRTGHGPTSKQELTGKDGGPVELAATSDRPRSLEEALARVEALRERIVAGKAQSN